MSERMKNNIPWNKGLDKSDPRIEKNLYAFNKPETKKKRKDAVIKKLKDKTYEEIHGEEKANKLKCNLHNLYVNKSFIERFGEEKAAEIGNKISIKSRRSNIEKYGEERAKEIAENYSKKRMNHKVTDDTKKKLSKFRTGKSYEQLVGEDKAKELKKQKSDNWKINNPNEKIKGKKLEDVYGIERAKELKDKRSQSLKNNHHWKKIEENNLF